MNNNQTIWAKTLLNAYKYLEALCGAIDKLVENTAKNSFFACGTWSEENSIMNISKKIIRLSDKKVDYINLKVITEKAIGMLDKRNAKVIILKYIKGLDIDTITSVLNMSRRSYFRRINDGLLEFMAILNSFGYGKEKLEINFLKDDFILSLYNSTISLCGAEIPQTERMLSKNAFTRQMRDLSFGLA